jgi:HEAT repeat protein
MRTTICITTVALLLGLAGSTAAQDGQPEPHKVYDRDRGELSIGTQIPTRNELKNAIRSAAPSALMAMLEYGERLECYECVPLLKERILESDHDKVREFAAWWIRRRPFAIGRVMRDMKSVLTNDSDPTRRARAAEAIGEFLDPNGFQPLRRAAMNDAAPKVRAAAVEGLGRLNHPDAGQVLAEALRDGSADVRRSAISVVLKVNYFSEHDALIGRLDDEDAMVRRRAAKLLGEFQVEAAVPSLVGMLRMDSDRDARQAAAWALGKIGTADARDALNEAMQQEENSLVKDAIQVALAM